MKPRSGLPKVSPSLIVACIALLVALGGTSLAAVSVILPANSVGTKQLKNNAVTSAKVKDGSLKAIDLAPGVLAASPGVGAAGPAGPAGAPGAAGPTGATGPSDAFSAYRDAISPPPLPANATTTIVTLALQPGKYVIVGKVNLDDVSGSSKVITCRLTAEGDGDEVLVTVPGTSTGEEECVMTVVHEFTAAGNARLSIQTPVGSSVRPSFGKVTAIRVGSISNTSVSG